MLIAIRRVLSKTVVPSRILDCCGDVVWRSSAWSEDLNISDPRIATEHLKEMMGVPEEIRVTRSGD
jgi:hypothetical protein